MPFSDFDFDSQLSPLVIRFACLVILFRCFLLLLNLAEFFYLFLTTMATVDGDEYEFDDVLDSFERKFAKTLAQREPLEEAAEKRQALRPLDAISKYEPADFPEELALLLKEVRSIVIENRRKSAPGSPLSQNGGDVIEKDIGREVMRAEIRSTLTKLKSMDDSVTDGDDMNSSQRTTFASMKRRLRENGEEISQLRKQKKQLELKSRNLLESHETYQTKIRMLENKESLTATERGELDAKVREQETSVFHLAADKKRLERNVGTLRTELLHSHHRLSEQKLKTTQAERKISDLESRQSELRENENALSERVKELHKVQGEMLEEMKRVVDSKDSAGARRALTNLAQKRSRIVGKIANILTKKSNLSRQGSTRSARSDEEGAAEGMSRSDSDLMKLPTMNDPNSSRRMQTMQNARADSRDSNGEEQSSGPPAVSRKSSIMQLFRRQPDGNAGNQTQPLTREQSAEQGSVVPSPLSRTNKQQIYETNLVRSREAAHKDTDVLREVVQNKTSEIDKLEALLKDAKEHSEKLELELQSERLNKRKENRNLHIREEEEPKRQINMIMKERSRPSTLFDWQASSRGEEKGDGAGMSYVPGSSSADGA